MDTGNNLIDPYSNKKVIIINEEVEENFFLIPYQNHPLAYIYYLSKYLRIASAVTS